MFDQFLILFTVKEKFDAGHTKKTSNGRGGGGGGRGTVPIIFSIFQAKKSVVNIDR